MTAYVALGDSFTAGAAGSGERAGRTRLRGLLRPRDVGYANLAVAGRDQRRGGSSSCRQAIELDPDLVTVVCGANDALAPCAPTPRAYAAPAGARCFAAAARASARRERWSPPPTPDRPHLPGAAPAHARAGRAAGCGASTTPRGASPRATASPLPRRRRPPGGARARQLRRRRLPPLAPRPPPRGGGVPRELRSAIRLTRPGSVDDDASSATSTPWSPASASATRGPHGHRGRLVSFAA